MARVLVIEDEPLINAIISEALRDEGYAVDSASDGQAGLELLARQRPDLVIADLFMPRLSGRAVVASMRADPGLQAIPVIIVTGAVPNTADFPPPGSYQALLLKPFDLNELLLRVRQLLERKL